MHNIVNGTPADVLQQLAQTATFGSARVWAADERLFAGGMVAGAPWFGGSF